MMLQNRSVIEVVTAEVCLGTESGLESREAQNGNWRATISQSSLKSRRQFMGYRLSKPKNKI